MTSFIYVGWGTDEKAIIRVLGHRNASQRKEIREAYQQLCNQSLIDGLSAELSGDFGVSTSFSYSLRSLIIVVLASEFCSSWILGVLDCVDALLMLVALGRNESNSVLYNFGFNYEPIS